MTADLADPGSAVVIAALEHRCGLCKAPVGESCRNTIRPSEPLPGRVVHYYRLEAA